MLINLEVVLFVCLFVCLFVKIMHTMVDVVLFAL